MKTTLTIPVEGATIRTVPELPELNGPAQGYAPMAVARMTINGQAVIAPVYGYELCQGGPFGINGEIAVLVDVDMQEIVWVATKVAEGA